jgi:hypothetical protein
MSSTRGLQFSARGVAKQSPGVKTIINSVLYRRTSSIELIIKYKTMLFIVYPENYK